MVQVYGRERHKFFANELGSLVRQDYTFLNLGEEADQLFDIFRKCRRDESAGGNASLGTPPNLSDGLADSLWQESRNGWGKVDKTSLARLYSDTKAPFESILTEFNSSRSRATHVLALFRPFQERYFDEWVSSVHPYPRHNFELRIVEIREFLVHDKIELAIWAAEVFELFKSAAVFYPENQEIIRKDPNRKGILPLGMISSQSVRIYGQQWRLWIREFEDAILKTADRSMGSSIPRMPDDISEKSAQSERFESKENGVEIRISPVGDESLTAKRSWIQIGEAAAGVRNWIRATARVWSIADSPCRAMIRTTEGAATSEISIKAESFEALAELLERYITNL